MLDSRQAPTPRLFAAELRYFGIPRDHWELALARAWQLGANVITAPVPWAWHALRPAAFDFDGAADARRDLRGFVQLCGRLGLRVLLDPGPLLGGDLIGGAVPPWLNDRGAEPIAPDSNTWSFSAAARQWIAAFSAALLSLQFPDGPIVGLRLGRPDEAIAGWLREEGWAIPIEQEAGPTSPFGLGEPNMLGFPSNGPALAAKQTLHAPIRPDGSARPGFWRAKMTWMLLGAARGDFARARPPSALDDPDARHAWADGEGVDLEVRYGAEYIFLFIQNRRASAYSGLLAYRAPDTSVLHLHVGVGAGRSGLVLLRDDEVVGAAIDGEASEGGWLARGLHTSAIFSGGAACMAPCGEGLLLMAPHGGRFQLRRREGWGAIDARRLLLNGAVEPAPFQIDATHLSVPYVAEDERGQTDMYLVLPASEPLPANLREYLATLLAVRIEALRHAAALARANVHDRTATTFDMAAQELDRRAADLATLETYGSAWRSASDIIQPAIAALQRALDEVRASYLGGAVDSADYEQTAGRLARIIRVAAHGDAAI